MGGPRVPPRATADVSTATRGRQRRIRKPLVARAAPAGGPREPRHQRVARGHERSAAQPAGEAERVLARGPWWAKLPLSTWFASSGGRGGGPHAAPALPRPGGGRSDRVLPPAPEARGTGRAQPQSGQRAGGPARARVTGGAAAPAGSRGWTSTAPVAALELGPLRARHPPAQDDVGAAGAGAAGVGRDGRVLDAGGAGRVVQRAGVAAGRADRVSSGSPPAPARSRWKVLSTIRVVPPLRAIAPPGPPRPPGSASLGAGSRRRRAAPRSRSAPGPMPRLRPPRRRAWWLVRTSCLLAGVRGPQDRANRGEPREPAESPVPTTRGGSRRAGSAPTLRRWRSGPAARRRSRRQCAPSGPRGSRPGR